MASHYAVEGFYGAQMKRPETIGAWVGAVGGLVFVAGQLIRLLNGGEVVIGIGVLLLVSGLILVVAGLVRTRIQPPWPGILLGFGTIVFLGFKIQPVTAIVCGLS